MVQGYIYTVCFSATVFFEQVPIQVHVWLTKNNSKQIIRRRLEIYNSKSKRKFPQEEQKDGKPPDCCPENLNECFLEN
jgi:hypothetical protein